MSLRAKFKVSSVKQNIGTSHEAESEEIEMYPVYSSDPNSENAQWSKATPSGSIKLFISNRAAFGQLGLGKEFYIDFTPAE